MQVFKPTVKSIIFTIIIYGVFLIWYINQLDTLFNPKELPSCWSEAVDVTNLIPCASPFRAFTYGLPVGLISLILIYIAVSLLVALVFKNKKRKK